VTSTVYAYAPTGYNFTEVFGPSGDLLIGGYDSNLANGTINWVSSPLNVSEPDWWLTNVTGFTLNGTSYLNTSDTSTARFMTGIPGIGLNSTMFFAFCSQL
jgi:hypothetical protein